MSKTEKASAINPSAKKVAEAFARSIGRSTRDPGTMRLAAALSQPEREHGFDADPFDGGCPADTEAAR